MAIKKISSGLLGLTGSLLLGLISSLASAAPSSIDAVNPANGLTSIFSFTFDGELVPCGPASPAYCPFFRGDPTPTRFIAVVPSPTGVANLVPGGITGAVSGSFLDLELSPGNTQVTIRGGTIAFQTGLQLNIGGSTIVTPGGVAGFVINAGPQVANISADGVAEFLVDREPSLAADFSTFRDIVAGPFDGTGIECSGSLCNLIPILTLDMFRYRLLVDYDPSFTFFTADFIGQTANTSLVFATLNSVAPDIAVTDSVAPGDDLLVPFGEVTELTSATQTVTITNTGRGSLLLGAVALANPLAAPFAVVNDSCSGATVAPAANCTFNVRFLPGSVGTFSDSLDVPSNDADEPSITVSVSGSGTALPVPNISVTDSVAPATDQTVPFGNAAIGATVTESVTVTNDGNASLVLGSVASANGLLAPFSVVNDNCSNQSVAPAASCTLGVRFQPTGAGVFVDTFDIPSNDAADPTVTISLSGGGTLIATPKISVIDGVLPADDLFVPFGNITEGTSRNGTLTITNIGGLDLLIGAIAGANPLTEPFGVLTDSCSAQTLAPAASCTVLIRYSPPVTGASSDSLDIPSNDPDDPTVTVSVTGTGITFGEGGVVTPSPDGADSGFMAIDPATLALLGAAGVWGWRRRRAQ